ncbi:tannase and feruloyl esterase [Aspergillus sclerotioniger CBS 115572]|uniref:Carboxylic ester hydrolase n=1 Tax=Aspergillus sclerotioniger CBS 115572 TaxID=1450535 RepID=A0A317XCW7_9EURO|nr:tannase and feruloyl esterase [Aspergillus sclerotioniger CBS 115572]PWY95971.1 tannase and feruloyl esterase [Aspergillus sclerotioniger CBS 115572]
MQSIMLLFLVTNVIAWLSSTWHPQKQPCNRLTLHSVPGIDILSIHSQERYNYSFPHHPEDNDKPIPNFCDITITLTHPGDDDIVTVSTWLPLTNWNSRFQATGGGGLAAGYIGPAQVAAITQGYAVSSTDGGLTLNNTIDPQTGTWALRPDRSLNTALLKNYAHRSIHDMTVIGKALTQTFYGTPPKYSYWNGCSTGGRQGYFAAALYPDLFDGILAGSPAINLPHLFSYLFWAPILMLNSITPPQCIFRAFQSAAIETCDPLDGATDGLISTPTPPSAPSTLPPSSTQQSNGTANTTTNPTTGHTTITPFFPAIGWTKNFIFQDPSYDISTMNFTSFDTAALLSISRYNELLGSDTHHLHAFHAAGGKLLSWHGLADDIIPYMGTVRYRERIEAEFYDEGEGEVDVDDFYRLFLAPGVGHCGGGYGPGPIDPLGALVRWVEEDLPPERWVTRELCRFPLRLVYDGVGDMDDGGILSVRFLGRGFYKDIMRRRKSTE